MNQIHKKSSHYTNIEDSKQLLQLKGSMGLHWCNMAVFHVFFVVRLGGLEAIVLDGTLDPFCFPVAFSAFYTSGR